MMISETYSSEDYRDKLVAFLDILGFHRLISQDKVSALASINMIDGHLKHILTVLHDPHGKDFSTRLFSDCMCISCDYSTENLFYILFELAFIQYYLSREGVFLRGALSRGLHFENSRMIFSKGLVNAYHLENSATYPRVIIDAALVDCIKEDKDSYIPIYESERSIDYVIQSPDRLYSVDYLYLIHQDGLDSIEELERHKQSIETTVDRNSEDSGIINKCRWLADYHNSKISEVIEGYAEPSLSEIMTSTSINTAAIFPNFTKNLMEHGNSS